MCRGTLRSWMLPCDDPEFWNPKVRLPLCLNPPAARSHRPLTFNQTELAFSRMSKTQMFDRTKTAFDKSELPVCRNSRTSDLNTGTPIPI
jgi:hypothetical protein